MNKVKMTWDEYDDALEDARKIGEKSVWRRIKNVTKNALFVLFLVLLLIVLVLLIIWLWRALM